MNIPKFVQDKVIGADGRLTPSWHQLFSQLLNEMNTNVSNNGFVVPSRTNDDINAMAVNVPNGTILYDSDTNELKAKVNGVFVVIS